MNRRALSARTLNSRNRILDCHFLMLPTPQHLSRRDQWLATLDLGLKTLAGVARASRPAPGNTQDEPVLDEAQRREAAALMRVNHVGEVCAQALYRAQALSTRDPQLREHFEQAAQEEVDHLAWTSQRLAQLQSHRSWLNPLWWGGAFMIGTLAGRLGDRVSLGFVVETERQVEAHLASHLQRLPEQDHRSRAIVEQMKTDEAQHALEAQQLGAVELPSPVRQLMRGAARVMTRTAHHI